MRVSNPAAPPRILAYSVVENRSTRLRPARADRGGGRDGRGLPRGGDRLHALTVKNNPPTNILPL